MKKERSKTLKQAREVIDYITHNMKLGLRGVDIHIAEKTSELCTMLCALLKSESEATAVNASISQTPFTTQDFSSPLNEVFNKHFKDLLDYWKIKKKKECTEEELETFLEELFGKCIKKIEEILKSK